jgi:hypothetical protein
MVDYQAYQEEFGVLPMPKSYDHVEQIYANTVRKMIIANGANLLLIAFLLSGLIIYMIYRRKRD